MILNFNLEIRDEGIIELALSTYLSRLTQLGLTSIKVSALGLISILESEHLTSLTALDLKLIDFRTSYMATRGGQQQPILPCRVACLNLCHTSGIAISRTSICVQF